MNQFYIYRRMTMNPSNDEKLSIIMKQKLLIDILSFRKPTVAVNTFKNIDPYIQNAIKLTKIIKKESSIDSIENKDFQINKINKYLLFKKRDLIVCLFVCYECI